MGMDYEWGPEAEPLVGIRGQSQHKTGVWAEPQKLNSFVYLTVKKQMWTLYFHPVVSSSFFFFLA